MKKYSISKFSLRALPLINEYAACMYVVSTNQFQGGNVFGPVSSLFQDPVTIADMLNLTGK